MEMLTKPRAGSRKQPGDLIGDQDLQRDGKKDQIAGKLKGKLADAKDKIDDMIDDIRNTDSKD